MKPLLLSTLTVALGASLASAAETRDPALVAGIKEIITSHEITPLDRPEDYSQEVLDLGQALFFDPILGGNQDVSCATCHHPLTATGDGRSRAVGTQAYDDNGRRMPVGFNIVDVKGMGEVLMGFNLNGAAHPFTPRNSPDLFNRGDHEWRTMFWDSRIHLNDDGKFAVNNMRISKSPGLYQVVMPDSIENIASAQAMMPVLSDDEMRGTKGQSTSAGGHNEVGAVLKQNEPEIWAALVKRLLNIEGYREMFAKAFPDVAQEDLEFSNAANAIGAFEIKSFSFFDSPWDRFIEGDETAMSDEQMRGAHLFFGKANCSTCHTGRIFTDQEAYNIGIIPMGPGPSMSEDEDFGIAHRSNAGLDMKWAFRTPPLRNVELTGPWMHNGAYTTLEAAVRHHLDPVKSLKNYDPTQLEPEFRGSVHDDKAIIKDVQKTMSPIILEQDVDLTDEEFSDLMAFLSALTSPSARDLEHTIPESVPSGLEMVLPFINEPVSMVE